MPIISGRILTLFSRIIFFLMFRAYIDSEILHLLIKGICKYNFFFLRQRSSNPIDYIKIIAILIYFHLREDCFIDTWEAFPVLWTDSCCLVLCCMTLFWRWNWICMLHNLRVSWGGGYFYFFLLKKGSP